MSPVCLQVKSELPHLIGYEPWALSCSKSIHSLSTPSLSSPTTSQTSHTLLNSSIYRLSVDFIQYPSVGSGSGALWSLILRLHLNLLEFFTHSSTSFYSIHFVFGQFIPLISIGLSLKFQPIRLSGSSNITLIICHIISQRIVHISLNSYPIHFIFKRQHPLYTTICPPTLRTHRCRSRSSVKRTTLHGVLT